MKNPGELFASTVFLATFAAAMSAVVDAGLRREPAIEGAAVPPVASGVDPRRKAQAPSVPRGDSQASAVAQTVPTSLKEPR